MVYKTYIPPKDIFIYNTDGTLYHSYKQGIPITLWIDRTGKIWRRFSIKILERDNYTCQKCGTSKKLKSNIVIQVHHKIPVKKNVNLLYEEDNCITLCKQCHKLAHKPKNDDQ